MADRLKLTAHIFVETEGDREEVARDLDSGLLSAISHFPGGEVVAAHIEDVEEATDEEVRDYFEE